MEEVEEHSEKNTVGGNQLVVKGIDQVQTSATISYHLQVV